MPTLNSNQWLTHFQKLLNIQQSSEDNPFCDYVNNSLPTVEAVGNSTAFLDNEINENENGKASGLYRISNEMLKSGQNFLTRLLCKLFDIILNRDVSQRVGEQDL